MADSASFTCEGARFRTETYSRIHPEQTNSHRETYNTSPCEQLYQMPRVATRSDYDSLAEESIFQFLVYSHRYDTHVKQSSIHMRMCVYSNMFVRANVSDTRLPQDCLTKLRFLLPQAHLLSENIQKEIQLPTPAKLQYIITEDMDQRWEFLKQWSPGSKLSPLQYLVTKA